VSENAIPLNVWLYARKSRHLGDPDDEGIVDHQVSRLQRIAAERGLMLPGENVIREIGSAETIAGRPRFTALLDAWERLPHDAGGIVLVTEPERLSRGTLVERGRIAEALAKADVRIVTPSRVYNLRDPDDEMWFAFTSSLGRRELAVYKQRAKAKVEELLREGAIRNGRAPWGYRWSKDARALLPDGERFEALRRCCRDVAAISVRRLADREGVCRSTLNYTLRNPAICGWPAIHTAQHRGGQTWLPRAEWRWPEQQNDTYPHACTRAEWEQIQAVIEERNNLRGKTVGSNGWCRDVVRFVDAPYPVGLAGRQGIDTYAAFKDRSATASIAREPVHAAALESLSRLFSDPETTRALLRVYLAEEARRTSLAASPTDPTARLADLRRRYQESVDAEFDSEEPLRSALSSRRRRLEAEVRAAETALRSAKTAVDLTAGAVEAVTHFLAVGRSFAQQWPTVTEEERRALVNACIERIECRVRDDQGRRLTGSERLLRVVLQPWFADMQQSAEL
jgi:hypothetical protein